MLNIIDKTLQKNIDYIEKYQDFNYWTELPEKEVFLMNFSSSNVTSYESMRSITPANEELLN